MANLNSGLYKIINTANGKFYIGSTLDFKRRKRDHWRALRGYTHNNQYLQNSWNKHGADVFRFVSIVFLDPNPELLDLFEQRFLDYYNIPNKDICYNVSSRADTPYIWDDIEFREKRSHIITKQNIERWQDPESRRIQSKQVSGSNNPRSKLTEDDVRNIRYLSLTKSQHELSHLFDVSQPMIWNIVHHKRWTHIPPDVNDIFRWTGMRW